jgi:hypothetical protein
MCLGFIDYYYVWTQAEIEAEESYDVEEMNEFHAKFIANHPEYRGLYDPHRYDDEEDPCGPTDENNPLIHRGSF